MSYQNIYESMALGEQGELARGYEDISQAIKVILGTQKGSVAHEPLFGVDHLKYLDRPLVMVQGAYIAEILEALAMWEPRAVIESVLLTQEMERLHFTVRWRPRDTNILKETVYIRGA